MAEQPRPAEQSNQVVLRELADTAPNRGIGLLAEYALGTPPSHLPRRYKDIVAITPAHLFPRGDPVSFGMKVYPFFDNKEGFRVDERAWGKLRDDVFFTKPQQAALREAYAEQEKDKDAYIAAILHSSEPARAILTTLQRIAGKVPRLGTGKVSPTQADMMAKEAMASAYGPLWEDKMREDPSIRNQYNQRRMWYEEQTAPSQEYQHLTVLEAVRMLENTLAEQGTSVFRELSKWEDFSIVPVDRGGPIPRTPQDVVLLVDRATDATKFDLGARSRRSLIIGQAMLHGRPVQIAPGHEAQYIGTSERDISYRGANDLGSDDLERWYHQVLSELQQVTRAQVADLIELGVNIDLLVFMKNWRQHLVRKNFPPFGKNVHKPLNSALEGSEFLDSIQWWLHKAKTNPAVLASAHGSFSESLLNSDRVAEFIGWHQLRSLTATPSPIPSFPFKDERKGVIKSFLNDALSDLLPRLRHRSAKTPDHIPHNIGETSGMHVEPITQVLMDEMKKVMKPHFVIKGHPWKHMRQLSSVTELSTYPDTNLSFTPYVLPENPGTDNLYITSTQPVGIGHESGIAVARIYAPEYSRLTSLTISNSNNIPLVVGEDFQIEYEGETGHYRLVFTPQGSRKIDSTINFTAGIDPNKLVEDATPLAPSLEVAEVKRLKEFAQTLWGRNQTAIAQNIENLLISAAEKGKTITTQDIENAIKYGSRYAFTLLPQQLEESFQLQDESATYLPASDSEGKATLQCAHAAMLMSEAMNYVFDTEAFRSTPMLTTINTGLGHVFAGAPHADSRGVHAGRRVRHDATPDPELKSILDILKARSNGPQKQKAVEQLQARELARIQEKVKEVTMQERVEQADASFKSIVDTAYQLNGSSPLHAPEAMKQVGTVLRSVRDVKQLLTDPVRTRQLLEEIERAQKLWSVAGETTPNTLQMQAKFKHAFGAFQHVAPDVQNVATQLKNILEQIRSSQ